MKRPDKIAEKCSTVQSWALMETCFEYTVSIMELLLRIWDSVELEDLKCILGEFGQWFLAHDKEIKAITKQEETKNVFANDTFETGYKESGHDSQNRICKNLNFDTVNTHADMFSSLNGEDKSL